VDAPRPSPRVARRRACQRERILGIAARRFATEGVESVRLDQIADEADVSRNTLYSHFATKEQLVEAVMRPALEQGVAELRRLARRPARERIDGILALYLCLWREHASGLVVASRLRTLPPGPLADLHEAFAQGVLSALAAAARAGILRVREPLIAARVVMRVAIPLLELYARYDNLDTLFADSMRGLLVVDAPDPAAPRRPRAATAAPAPRRQHADRVPSRRARPARG